jgi:O-antigen ligase
MYDGTINLNTATYADLVRILNTTDLSFIFRLKHWLNLLNIFQNGSGFDWMFGFGIGSSVALSDIRLVPHNDYLRYLFETGYISLIGFAMFMWTIMYNCGRRWESVPLFTITIYFFSENLINNYIAMSIFYFCAGALVLRIKLNETPVSNKYSLHI